ncbi:MAG: hypothetical protein KDC98_09845 [Planctomycetes bacterium]|nr:hypothetical protein [Planctomycetota bacterium]
MTANDIPAPAPPQPPQPTPRPDSGLDPGRWSLLSDWLNPIVVREVQQALKGRAFVLSVMAALIVVIAIALVVASDFNPASSGRNAFDAGLATLVPLLLFVTPMSAYQSMRHELKVGMVDQLLLSELRPRRIIMGKLAAAMVQFVLYVSVIAPLLATSYLLRGVDMPMIGISLLFALLFCVVATAFAVSSAAQGMMPAMQGLSNLAVAVGLAMGCMGLVGYIGSGEYARDIAWLLRSSELSTVVSSMIIGGLASCTMSGLTAATFLAHAHENKSSGFRVFLLILVAVVFGWVALFIDPAHRGDVAAAATVALMIGGALFAIFMVTEQERLSPRVQAHVPQNAALALLVAPLLPGRQRGMLCFLLFCVLLGGIAALTWPVAGTRAFVGEARRFALFVAAYAVIYLSLAKWIRGRLPASLVGNHLARFSVPVLLFLFCILPVLLDVVIKNRVRGWHPGHCMNPFWTIERFAFGSRGSESWLLDCLLIAAIGMVLLQVPALIEGVREVLRASARRRQYVQDKAAGTEAAVLD